LETTPPIVCAVDDRYVAQLCVMIQSLAMTQPDPESLRLVVLHRRLAEESRERVRFHSSRVGLRVELREVEGAAQAYPVSRWVTDAVYLRLSMPEAMPDAPVVLYLDADLVVVGDLGPLLRTALRGAPLAAVRDEQNPILRGGRALPRWWELGLPATREYFSSGVMVVDLARGDVFERCHRFLRDLPQHVRWWDQDALNWAVEDDWVRLDRRWNTVPLTGLSRLPGWVHQAEDVSPLQPLLDGEEAAAILHFAGPHKPWDLTYPASPVRDRYRSLMRMVAEAEP
jgi:UDP-D-galactose:(glucosyl)LPS alpha-1,3-D-galactosyltransferase